jgi:uncharacterized membrane protein YkgB
MYIVKNILGAIIIIVQILASMMLTHSWLQFTDMLLFTVFVVTLYF